MKQKYYDENRCIITDAPNPGDMQKIQDNLDRVMKVQGDYWNWKKNQDKLGGFS